MIRLALPIMLALAGCAAPPGEVAPQARYLTPGTTPICLAFCTVVVTNTEAAQFPVLRQTSGDFTGNSKSTTSTSSVTTP
jgi:hypothetical protein